MNDPQQKTKEKIDGWRMTEVLGPILLAIVAGIFTLFQFCDNKTRIQQNDNRLAQEKQIESNRLAKERENEKERIKVDRSTIMLKHFASNECNEQLLAMKVAENLKERREFPEDIYLVIERMVKKGDCLEVREEAKEFIEKSANNPPEEAQQNIVETKSLANVNKEAFNNLKARIYIHVLEGQSLEQAKRLKKKFEAANLVVPEITQVSEVTNETELRYFKGNNEDDLTLIESILNSVLNDEEIKRIKKIDLAEKNPSEKAKPRHYEIWFGRINENKL